MPERRLDVVLGDVDDELLEVVQLLGRDADALAVVANTEHQDATLGIGEAAQVFGQLDRSAAAGIVPGEACLAALEGDFFPIEERVLAGLDLADQLVGRVVHHGLRQEA
jgi:hypothetical protein